MDPADNQQLSASKDQGPPEQQDSKPSLDQQDASLPRIKEEPEEPEEPDGTDIIEFTFSPEPVKSEDDDEEKPQASRLRQTTDVKTEADVEDCGGPDPDLRSGPHEKTSESSDPQSDLKNNFSCSQCSKTFSKTSNLKSHMRIHTGEKPFSCSVCGKTFTQKATLSHHMTRHTGEKRYCCGVCGERFTWQPQLKKHRCVCRQQGEANTDAGTDGEDCGGPEPACNSDTERHPPPADRDQTLDSESDTDDSCDWEETDLNSLHDDKVPESGMELAPGDTNFCHEEHLRVQTEIQAQEKPFSCSVCGKRYHWRKSLLDHMKLHSDEKCFSCSFCNKTFQHRGHVVTHMRVHTGEKPFDCTVCGKRFTIDSNLTRHLRVHTGEKPFSCSVCKTSFSDSGNLSKHMRVHTGEKPYSCTVCDKRFTQISHIKKHKCVSKGSRKK